MQNFKFSQLGMNGLFLIEPFFVEDERGYFLKSYEKRIFSDNGIKTDVFEAFESMSAKNVIRGLHFQTDNPQSKIIRCVSGKIFDVAIDLRKNSPTFGEWRGEFLSAENRYSMFIPAGFAHGFLSMSDKSITQYTCSGEYSKGSDTGIIFNDTDIGIEWPHADGRYIVSERDKCLQTFENFSKSL